MGKVIEIRPKFIDKCRDYWDVDVFRAKWEKLITYNEETLNGKRKPLRVA